MLYHAQVKLYYADTMLTRANHVMYHVTNVAMVWLPMIEIEVCSSFEPEIELGIATSATAPSLLDRLMCPAQSELSRERKTMVFNEFLLPKCSIMPCFWLLLCSKLCWHYPPRLVPTE